MKNLKEEILALSEQWKEEPWAHIYNQALVDASHVLDKWEFVAGGELTHDGRASYLVGGRYLHWFLDRLVKPGDTIAIYRKRKE